MRPITAAICLVVFLSVSPLEAADENSKPFQVFILAGQSNMEGQAVADLSGKDYNGGRGTLLALLDDPEKAPKVRHLRSADG